LFKHRSSFPRIAVWTVLSGTAIHLLIMSLESLIPTARIDPQASTQNATNLIGAVFWSVYLLRSQRVKATFVKRYRANAPLALPKAAEGISS
jgi:hypothetical protein